MISLVEEKIYSPYLGLGADLMICNYNLMWMQTKLLIKTSEPALGSVIIDFRMFNHNILTYHTNVISDRYVIFFSFSRFHLSADHLVFQVYQFIHIDSLGHIDAFIIIQDYQYKLWSCFMHINSHLVDKEDIFLLYFDGNFPSWCCN